MKYTFLCAGASRLAAPPHWYIYHIWSSHSRLYWSTYNVTRSRAVSRIRDALAESHGTFGKLIRVKVCSIVDRRASCRPGKLRVCRHIKVYTRTKEIYRWIKKLKGKDSPYSITERTVPELIRFLAVSLQVMWVINPAVGCRYFPPGLQLPPQPLRGVQPILLLGTQRHSGCKQFA